MANEQSPQTYAQALFEQATADWLTPLKRAAECIKPADAQILDQPGVEFAKKQEILQRVLPGNTPAQVKNFIFLLASQENIHQLPTIIAEFDRYTQRGPLRAVTLVTSAVALTDDEKRALEAKLRARYGADSDFQYKVDAAILGGVVVRMGDKVIDGSVAGKLAALKEKLK